MAIKIGNNADEVAANLAAIARRAASPEPQLKIAAEELRAIVDDTFRESTSAAGERWPALAPSTLLRRALSRGGKRRKVRKNKSTGYSVGVDLGLSNKAARNISNVKPLVDTGRGRGSIRVRASGRTVTISTDAQYMVHHLRGPKPPRRAWAPVIDVGGRWMFDTRGKGGAWLSATKDRLKRYVLTGQVS